MDLWETLDKKLGQKKKLGSLPETILHPSPTGSETPHPPALQATLRVPGTHGHTSGVFWSQIRLMSQAAPLTLMNRLESLAGNCPPPVSMWCFIRKPMPRTPLTAMGIWKVPKLLLQRSAFAKVSTCSKSSRSTLCKSFTVDGMESFILNNS